MGRYAFLTGGKCISTQRLDLILACLIMPSPVYTLFVSSYDLVLVLLFLTQRTDPLSRIGRTQGKKGLACSCSTMVSSFEADALGMHFFTKLFQFST